jgi:hypothetical protein
MRAVFLCPGVCRLVSLQTAVSRCPRTHGGRDSSPITVGAHRRLFHGRPRTGRADGVFPGLTRGAESGVHPCVAVGGPRWFPRTRGGPGKAGALMARAVRESVTVAGRTSGPGLPGRSRPGCFGPGHPCEDDAALLVSELFANRIRHGGSGAEGRRSRPRSGPPAAWSGSRSHTAAAGVCRNCGPAVVRRKVAGGWGWPRGRDGGGAARMLTWFELRYG